MAVPLAVWSVAFLVWLFWPELAGYTVSTQTSGNKKSVGTTEQKTGERQGDKSTQQARERIADEDRKKLNDILERR